jgi:predicted phosphodiesterase
MSEQESKIKDNRYRLKPNEIAIIQEMRKSEVRNILIIGDLHEPFCLDGYLEYCQEQYKIHNCNQVVFIGDIIDAHGFSYHEPDPDGMSSGLELETAIKKIAKWYEAFPYADVMIGNHDRMASRKAMSGGIPAAWIRSYNEVLGTPNWNWCESIIYDDVLYEHGEGGQAAAKAKNNLMSSVCGHTHTLAYTQWFVGKRFKVFGMQVGCGVDSTSYAAAYAKNFKKQSIGCSVVLNNGTLPINLLMPL